MDAPKRTVEFARNLRKTLSLPEVILWEALRRRSAGLKFRKQHPLGPYVLDFYCHSANLAVEVDGADHGLGDRPKRDARRDAWLLSQGVRTMRVMARDVLADCDGVYRDIVAFAGDPLPLGLPPESLPPEGAD